MLQDPRYSPPAKRLRKACSDIPHGYTNLCIHILLANFSRALWLVIFLRYISRNAKSKHRRVYIVYCWFSHDVTKFQTSELLILLRFYFHDWKEQLKTNVHTNFQSGWVLNLVIDYAWNSKLLRDLAFAWGKRELWCWFKRWLMSGNSAIRTVLVLKWSIIVTFLSTSRDKFTLL